MFLEIYLLFILVDVKFVLMLVILAVVFEVVFCCTCDGGHGNLDGQDNDAHQMNQSDRGSLMTNYIYNYEYIYIYIYRVHK